MGILDSYTIDTVAQDAQLNFKERSYTMEDVLRETSDEFVDAMRLLILDDKKIVEWFYTAPLPLWDEKTPYRMFLNGDGDYLTSELIAYSRGNY